MAIHISWIVHAFVAGFFCLVLTPMLTRQAVSKVNFFHAVIDHDDSPSAFFGSKPGAGRN